MAEPLPLMEITDDCYAVPYFHWTGATAKITALQKECEVI